jgi:hypothetical protein
VLDRYSRRRALSASVLQPLRPGVAIALHTIGQVSPALRNVWQVSLQNARECDQGRGPGSVARVGGQGRWRFHSNSRPPMVSDAAAGPGRHPRLAALTQDPQDRLAHGRASKIAPGSTRVLPCWTAAWTQKAPFITARLPGRGAAEGDWSAAPDCPEADPSVPGRQHGRPGHQVWARCGIRVGHPTRNKEARSDILLSFRAFL